MFENMNPLDKSTAWLEIFLLMFGAFLIGYFFARWYFKNKSQKELEDCEEEKRLIKLQQLEHANSTFPSGIRAVKTRERRGEMVQPVKEQTETKEVEFDSPTLEFDLPSLDFNSIGSAKEEDKDDLRKIHGVGPFIEKKLNSIGIYTYEQISRFTKKDIKDVTELIQFFPGRIERDDWVGQAKKLME